MPSQKLPGAGRGKGKRINGLKSSKHDLPAADPRDVTAHRWRKRFCSPVFDGHQRTEMVYKGWAETWVGARRGSERRGDPHCMAETPSAEAGPPVEIPFSNRVPHTSLHDLFATEAPAALLIAEDDGAVPAIKPVDARWRAGADLPAGRRSGSPLRSAHQLSRRRGSAVSLPSAFRRASNARRKQWLRQAKRQRPASLI